MPNIRSTLAAAAQRATGNRDSGPSVSNTVVPAETSGDYNPELAAIAASILYRSPVPSNEGRPVYILNSAAFPDAHQVDYNSLLAYVLAVLPSEESLISGTEYEMVFLAGGQADTATSEKRQGPDRGWYVQAYHVLSRATRKKLKRLYIVHTRSWVRVLVILFSSIASRKFSRKIEHVSTLSQLALHLSIEKLLIPPSAYLQDRKVSPEIYAPFVTGTRAFGARRSLPRNIVTGRTRLPRVLRETTSFLCHPTNLKTEGLFRIPPHSVLTGILKEAYDRGQQFIIWREQDAVFAPPGLDASVVDDVQIEDAYGVHLATALIKTWYRELREPLVPSSSYANLMEVFEDHNQTIPPEVLMGIISPASTSSPLSAVSREILTRHLLPLLHTVAAHEMDNKMNPENLAVLFAMSLVCGPDQMQDAKMVPVVRVVLQAAISTWPHLRSDLGIDAHAFTEDLSPPPDARDYEDPLDNHKETAQTIESEVENRIEMRDVDNDADASPPERTPTLPPRRRSRAASLKGAVKQVLPSLETLPGFHGIGRKGVSQQAEESPADAPEPPRYSKIFDADGHSIDAADSPSTYAPVDGFGPARRADFSFDSVDDKIWTPQMATQLPGTAPAVEIAAPQPQIIVPKRKAVSSTAKAEDEVVTAETQTEAPRKSSDTHALLARMAAQQVASSLALRMNPGAVPPPPLETDTGKTTPTPTTTATMMTTTTTTPSTTASSTIFRKPLYPASSNRAAPNIQSLAKPVVPVRKAQTMPVPVITTHHVPKPRQPSPSLLKRINSMDPSNGGANPDASNSPFLSSKPTSSSTLGSGSALEPRRLNLKKASVDDLRRLYEERASTARSLQEAAAVGGGGAGGGGGGGAAGGRRGSSQTT